MGRIEKVILFNHSHHINGLIILRYNNYHLKMSVIGYVIQSHNQLQDLETLFHNLSTKFGHFLPCYTEW